MAKAKKPKVIPVQDLLVSSIAMSDALATLLIEKGIVTKEEFMDRLSAERRIYQKLLNPTVQ